MDDVCISDPKMIEVCAISKNKRNKTSNPEKYSLCRLYSLIKRSIKRISNKFDGEKRTIPNWPWLGFVFDEDKLDN